MPTSVESDCRLNAQDVEGASFEVGFSLLEVLVALGLIASAMSIAGLAAVPLIDRRDRAAEIRTVETFVRDARYAALTEHRAIALSTHLPVFLSRVEVNPFTVEADLKVYPNGRCMSGPMRVTTTRRVLDFRMEEDTCAIIVQR